MQKEAEHKPKNQLEEILAKKQAKIDQEEKKMAELYSGYSAEQVAAWNATQAASGGSTLEELAAYSVKSSGGDTGSYLTLSKDGFLFTCQTHI